MSTTLRTSRLIDLCTPSISYDAQVKSACSAFDRQMYEIIDETGVVIMIPNIMGINDPALIDILAWQFHVDFYDASRDLEFRKNLVQKSITWHMRKGTVDLVQEVLDTYWPGGASLVEWFDYYEPLPPGFTPPNPPYSTQQSPPIVPAPPGNPPTWHDRYRFRVYIDEHIIDAEDEAEVLELIDRYKPVSRWCEGIFRAIISDCTIGWCAVMLRFIYRASEEPDARLYTVAGPTTGTVNTPSAPFTVQLAEGGLTGAAKVTPHDANGRGTFTPAFVTVTEDARSAAFTYTARIHGTLQITTTNDRGLIDPPAVQFTVP